MPTVWSRFPNFFGNGRVEEPNPDEKALGIDVSFWQDNNNTPQKINWQTARAAGASFAFIKASQATFTDEDFGYNWQGAKQAGLLRGAYHFLDYRMNAGDQARYFANLLKNDPGELPPVLDVERHWTPYPSRSEWVALIEEFLTTLKNAGHRKVIFYSNPDMILNVLSPIPDSIKQCLLWIANYEVSEPSTRAVAPWGKWSFWQYTSKGSGPSFGVESQGVDLNWFNGSVSELKAFAALQKGEFAKVLQVQDMVSRLWSAHPELWAKSGEPPV